MAKKRKRTPLEIGEDDARQAKLEAMVAERIRYHAHKAAEAGERPIAIDRLLDPKTRRAETERLLRERIAYHEAKAREEEEAERRATG